MISTKEIILANTPIETGSLTLTIIGGIEQYEGIDFTLTEATISWQGYPLENELSEGDTLRIKYQIEE